MFGVHRHRVFKHAGGAWHAANYDSSLNELRNVGRAQQSSWGERYVHFPTAASNRLQTPLDLPPGDADFIFRIRFRDMTPAAAPCLHGQWVSGSRQWRAFLSTAGQIVIYDSTDGTAERSVYVGDLGAVRGAEEWFWLRIKRDVDNGANNLYSTFHADDSTDVPTSWTSLASGASGASGNLYTTSGQIYYVGLNTTVYPMGGDISHHLVYSGFQDGGGTIIYQLDPENLTDQTAFTLTVGGTGTLAGGARVITPGQMNLGGGIAGNAASPKRLVAGSSGYVWLPANNGNSINISLSRSMANVQEVGCRYRATTTNASTALAGPAANSQILLQGGTLIVSAAGIMRFDGYEDGHTTNRLNANSVSAIPGYGLGVTVSVKYILTRNDGAGNKTVSFWYRFSDGDSWTQLGSTSTSAGVWGTAYTLTDFRVATNAFSIASTDEAEMFYAWFAEADGGSPVVFIDSSSATQTTIANTGTAGGSATINRSSTGYKSVVVNKSTLAGVLSFDGVDDYGEVADNALLNFDAAQSGTVLALVVRHAAQADKVVIAKRAGLAAANPGYSIATNGAFEPLGEIADGSIESASAGDEVPGLTSVLVAFAAVRDTVADTITAYTNGITDASNADTTTGSLSNAEVLRIGRLSGAGTAYSTGEISAAAVWRRALSTSELARLKWELENYTKALNL